MFCFSPLMAQFSGYQSLQLPSGARNAALGGKVISLAGDITQFIHNPATLDSLDDTDIALSFSPYFAGIYQFSGQFYLPMKQIEGLAIGLSYLDYGDFVSTDPSGATGDSFRASDYVITIGKSHRMSSFSVGANLKITHSAIESYSSTAILADIGGMYHYPKGDFKVGLVFKNIGFRIKDYSGSSVTELPFDVQIGTSVKPQHMPVRFSITAYNLVEEDLVFRQDENESSRTVKAFDDFFRRINLGAEFIFSKHVHFLLGYNHLRRQELSLEETGAGAGFSYGLMIGIKKFTFRYARSVYHASGGANFITIQTNLRSFNQVL